MKTVRDVLINKGHSEIWSVAPIATVYDAIEIMSQRQVGALPVLQEHKLVGIISERDYARKVILKDKSSHGTRVSEIMTQDVITVQDTNRVDECIGLMQKYHIRHLVVEDKGQVTGVISLRDLFTEVINEQADTIGKLEGYISGEV